MFQNNSQFKVLDTQYKLFRNSDAFGDIRVKMSLESLTPKIKVTDGHVN